MCSFQVIEGGATEIRWDPGEVPRGIRKLYQVLSALCFSITIFAIAECAATTLG
jgi:hypothetical protein